jgi:putative transposase
MTHSPPRHRQSIRLQGYDYSQAGAYFLTICTHGRQCILGSINDDTVNLSRFGGIVEAEWLRTPRLRPNVELDEYVVMPNHLHAVLVIIDDLRSPSRGFTSPSRTIGASVRGFKGAVTKRLVGSGWPKSKPVWQRGYWDHIIRNEQDLNGIRRYIQDNPRRWSEDRENPEYGPPRPRRE